MTYQDTRCAFTGLDPTAQPPRGHALEQQATMHFDAERFSGYFRRSLAALESRHGAAAVRARLGALVAAPVDAPVIAELLRSEAEHARDGGARDESGVRGRRGAGDASGNGLPALPSEQAAAGILRRARQWLMLALIERDTSGAATLEEVCSAMSAFARQAADQAMRVAAVALLARHGRALDRDGVPQDLLAVGMGKVGGDELNVSSDLDLVFVFRSEGETEGVNGSGRIASSEWMQRLARRTIALLAEMTAEGFVFRIDTRLRPNGDSGPLVVPLPMLEHYFFSQGREWERFAWLKAKVLADSGAAGETTREGDEAALERIVEPFVFRRYMDYEAFAALRELHRMIRTQVVRRGARDPEAIDVKLGPGGIREIEFIAQLFQVVRGGRDPGLRDRRTLITLEALAERGLLPEDEAEELDRAYRLLRRTEHALQYRDDAQTHRLPHEPEIRGEVAAMLRLPAPAFDAAIDQATGSVAAIFDRLLAPAGGSGGDGVAQDDNEPAVVPDPEVERRFAAFRTNPRYAAAKQSTRDAIERLLAAAVRADTGRRGLVRLVDLLDTVCRRPAYVALLDQYPEAFERVLKILDWAKWPAEYLTRHPVVLDELLDGELLEPTDYRAWSEELAERVAAAQIDGQPDVERQMDIVREAHHAQVFRLMVQDLADRLTIERVSDHLSELADRVLDLAIEVVWSQLRHRFRERPRFAAIAYGRLGGKELGYASDLDLVFLFDDADERAPEAYALLAQRLSGWLSTRTAAGMLFEIDLRLRPNGAAGMLVSTVSAFEAYQREKAWPWEHQAITRARFSAGDAAIGERFEAFRRELLATPRDLGRLRGEVVAMRRKMHEGHPNRTKLFDLKHDRGGMVDIEFIVQYLVLAYSAGHPEMLDNKGNIALLGRAAQAGLVDPALALSVADAYRRYRRLQHTLRLDDASFARIDPARAANEREAVVALWEAVLGAEPPRR